MRQLWHRFKTAWYMHYSFDPLLLQYTERLVREAEALPGSGEYKRHQVYAKLIKQFPRRKRSQLALAIEVVICGL